MVTRKPPENPQLECRIFLAGSIEQGAAKNWQVEAEQIIHEFTNDVVILNPRRDHWDPSWKQSIENPQFRQQVEWELWGLKSADYIVMYFAGGTLSPITLMEFGMYANSGKLFVCADEAYWRRGNIEVVCDQNNLVLYDDFHRMMRDVIREIDAFQKI